MRMQAWNVYFGKRLLDTVFYESDCDHAYVRRSLIEHDGYHPSITVKRAR